MNLEGISRPGATEHTVRIDAARLQPALLFLGRCLRIDE
jgi:hypothetical protein